MAIRPVLRMGHPLLQRRSEPVTEPGTPALEALVADMLDTMAHEGGVGLAAPQIGVSLRVVVFGFEHNPRYPDCAPVPFTTLLNPVIEPLGAEQDLAWEGCLSVPGLRGLVPRHTRVRYRGLDLQGAPIEREVEGFHARVVQHECDHLDGVLYHQRMTDLRQLGFLEELTDSGRLEQATLPCEDP
ncbi:MAG TPA: peptide deformylase [Gammaproteobacteria bacterium]|nr:peptide deformylase [Gammaproteobacteria bacterium]